MLLKEATGQPLEQAVRQRLEGDDFVVTEIAPALGFGAPPETSRAPGMALPDRSADVQDALRARFDDALEVRDPIRLGNSQGPSRRHTGALVTSTPPFPGSTAARSSTRWRTASRAALPPRSTG